MVVTELPTNTSYANTWYTQAVGYTLGFNSCSFPSPEVLELPSTTNMKLIWHIVWEGRWMGVSQIQEGTQDVFLLWAVSTIPEFFAALFLLTLFLVDILNAQRILTAVLETWHECMHTSSLSLQHRLRPDLLSNCWVTLHQARIKSKSCEILVFLDLVNQILKNSPKILATEGLVQGTVGLGRAGCGHCFTTHLHRPRAMIIFSASCR